MDICRDKDLDKLIKEVFSQEERCFAELRLFPLDAEDLEQQYHAHCVPMDDRICSDGRIWYNVWMPTV